MTAGNYDITCEQGTTFVRTLTLTKSDGTKDDMSSWTARMFVKRRQRDTSTLIELTTENNRLTLGTGTVQMALTATETANLPDGGVYDLELIKPDGTVERLVQGQFILSLEVTR